MGSVRKCLEGPCRRGMLAGCKWRFDGGREGEAKYKLLVSLCSWTLSFPVAWH